MSATPAPALPGVSVVMPVLNEEPYLADSVARVLDQAYEGELELVLAVGPSADRTEQIAADLAAADPRVRVVANPSGTTPRALNAALEATRHAYVVRVDAHGFLPEGYVRHVVGLLESTGAANVGGRMQVEGEDDFGRAVAVAMSSRIGIGGSRFHVGGEPGPAETVYLGAFRRDVLERLGGYDPTYRRAQDWELNHRIRAAGEVVWFDPSLAVTYRPRRTVRALVRQFHHSGRWRRRVVEHYPETASPRYLAPPVATAAVAGGVVAGVLGSLTGSRTLKAGWLLPLGYATAVTAASFPEGRDLPPRSRAWLPVVVMTMHLSWGAGFLRNVDATERVGAAVRRAPRPSRG
ncbi:glycosyltransferase family 2 protein [Nocardioides zeae]|uniref:Glycosyltransferase family 2 protein n=1 Tax=Nocardioides imazamoxiresistens TaxID=3231893 RepID=A0ABU3PYT4_9ACTN|nr:glycosyltransferase family 2 protein [Nocardioides zeae]MDT9593967.1 glycosyltransferase family 2 protein [Nocardioides zeae]